MIPTLKIGRGKTVMLDNYFNYEKLKSPSGDMVDFHYIWSEMDNNGFSLLGHVFNKFGVRTQTLKDAPSSENLKGAGIYIIVDPDSKKESPSPNYIAEKHIEEINNWVKNGGILLLFGNDSANVETEHFSRLLNKFGVQLKPGSRNMVVRDQYEMGTINIPAGNSIFKTAKKVYLKEISTFRVTPPAKAMVTDKDDVIIAVAEVGKGKVFVVGDPWLYNEYTDGRKLPASFQNYQAAEDLVRWAIKQSK
jgi:unsaturated rhamnogalacturonyl hydrolase